MKKVAGVLLTGLLFACLISCSENNKPSPQNKAIDTITLNKMPDSEDGKMLFLNNCASCHAIYKELTGPALVGVQDRWKDKEMLYAFIRNSQEVIKDNQYAKDLFNKYNKVQMNPFPWIKDEQITAILNYIEKRNSEKAY